MGEGVGAKRSPFMKDFFNEVENIKHNMEQIKKNMKNLDKIYDTALASSSTKSNKQQEEIEDLMDQTSTLMKAVKEVFKKLEIEGKEHAKKSNNDAQARTRQNVHGRLLNNFLSLAQEYQEMQTGFKNRFRDRVRRQLKVAKPDATMQEFEELISEGSDNIFIQQMLRERSTQARALNALADIQDKHKEIVRLEQSIVELHQLFMDVSVLVKTRGEMLDRIESNVRKARKYVDSGVKQLEKAKQSQKKTRKQTLWLAVCTLPFLATLTMLPRRRGVSMI